MVVVPAVNAETSPVPDVMVATAVLVLLHVPPVETSDRVVVVPAQIVVVPVIGVVGFTVTMAVVVHPPAVTNVIVEVPGAIPLIMPVVSPAVATAVLPLVQVPVPATSVSVVVLPWQITSVPDIAAIGLIVTTAVETHPAAEV